MRILSISISLIILIGCSSELDRCIKANIDEPPTYTLKSLTDKENYVPVYGYLMPEWKNSADIKIRNCINNSPSYDAFNHKVIARKCIQEEEESRIDKAKAFCHVQGIY